MSIIKEIAKDSTMTCEEFYTEYYRFNKNGESAQTHNVRRNCIARHFLTIYDKTAIGDVTGDMIDNIFDTLKSRGFADNTLFGLRAALMSFFKLAITLGFLDHNPVKDSRIIKANVRKKTAAVIGE